MLLKEVSADVLAPVMPGLSVVAKGGVGDDHGLAQGGASVYRQRCWRFLWKQVGDVGRGRRYGVFTIWCDGGIPLDAEEEVLAVNWQCPGVGGFGDPMEADRFESRCDFLPAEDTVVDRSFPWQVSVPVVVRGGAVLQKEFHPGDGMCKGLLVGAFLCGGWGQRLGHLVVWLLRGPCFLQPCSDSGKDVVGGWRGAGVWCQIAAGDMVTRCVLGVLLYGDGAGGVVLRRPPLWVFV